MSNLSINPSQLAPVSEPWDEPRNEHVEKQQIEQDELKQKLALLAQRVERVEQRVAQLNAQQQREVEQQKLIE